MAFRRFGRRRKPRVLWLPNPGTTTTLSAGTDVTINNSGAEFDFRTQLDAPTTVEVPMVVDNPAEETEVGANLAAYQKLDLNFTTQWGYRLRRIVGKLFVSAAFDASGQDVDPPAVLINAGIIVRRVDDDTGQALQTGAGQDVATLRNNRDPWIWRRDWILGQTNGSNDTASVKDHGGLSTYAENNALAASVRDGPHIDQKTARVIGPEERLFMNLTASCLPLDQSKFTPNHNPLVYFMFQYRVLATIHMNQGNRRNASR